MSSGLSSVLVRKLKEKYLTQGRINRAGKIILSGRLVSVYETKDFIWGEVKRWEKGDSGLLPYLPCFRRDGAFMCTCRGFAVDPTVFCSHLIALILKNKDSPLMATFLSNCIEREVDAYED